MSVHDSRKAKFIWASVAALDHLRSQWDKERADCSAKAGLDVYHALTEVANGQKAREAIGADESAPFKGSQSEIAKRAMVSEKTIARACAELERIGLLLIEVDQEEGKRPGRPSIYVLVEPGQTSDRSSDVEGDQRRTGGQTSSEALSHVSAERRTGVRTSLYRGRRTEKKEEGARVVETEKAIAAWEKAKGLLFQRLAPEKFDILRELVAAGECDGCLVLVDHSGIGVRDWRDRAEPLILETVADFDAVEVLEEAELDEADPLSEFDLWLADYHEVTGRTAVVGSDEARKSFSARRKEGRTLDELKLATRGCHGNDYLRSEALDRPETILRKSKHARYIELGKAGSTSDGGAGSSEYDRLVEPAT